MKELALYEFQLERVAAVRSANAREMMESYADARADVDDEVARARGDTRELRAHLESARARPSTQGGVRGPASALRALTRPRHHRGGVRARWRRRSRALEEESDATAAKLHLRKKQFALLLHVVNELQEELEEDEAEEESGRRCRADGRGVVPVDAPYSSARVRTPTRAETGEASRPRAVRSERV